MSGAGELDLGVTVGMVSLTLSTREEEKEETADRVIQLSLSSVKSQLSLTDGAQDDGTKLKKGKER